MGGEDQGGDLGAVAIARHDLALPYEGGAMAAGPVSRLGSMEPREKTGLRLSP